MKIPKKENSNKPDLDLLTPEMRSRVRKISYNNAQDVYEVEFHISLDELFIMMNKILGNPGYDMCRCKNQEFEWNGETRKALDTFICNGSLEEKFSEPVESATDEEKE